MLRRNLEFSLLKLKNQITIQDKNLLPFSFLYYVMGLSFGSSISSIAGKTAIKN